VTTPNYGSVWCWTAIDADTKLVPTWLIGQRGRGEALSFVSDVKARLGGQHRVQITTDGLSHYADVIEAVWRDWADYAVMQKEYGLAPGEEERRYSPATVTGIHVEVITGNPDPDLISTSYVERQNLTMRMGMRRYTRLTNAHSKGFDQHCAAVALHFLHYNFARPHETLGKRVTPAMAAGIEQYPWSLHQIAELLD
jgi:IS1 family transposase